MKTTTKHVLQVLLFCLLAAMLSLGTAIATSAAEITSGSLDTSKTYTIGAENSGYTLVYSGGWRIKNNSEQYLKVDYGNATWGALTSASTFTVTPGNNGSTVSCQLNYTTMYLSYSNSSFSANAVSSNRVKIYDNNSGGSSDPVTPQQTTSQNTVKLYFTNNKKWSKVYAYVWNSETQTKITDWPGTELTKQSTNDYNEDIYSVTIDYSAYDYVIFNNNNGEQTVDINVLGAVENGGGIFLTKDGNDNFVTDASNHYEVSYYNHNIDFSKTIEKLSGEGHGDYDYRLHLNVMGEHLAGTTTTEEHSTESTGIAVLVEVNLDFTASWSNNKSKKEVIEDIVSNYLKQYEGTNVKVSVIAVQGIQSVHYDASGQTDIISTWDNYSDVSFDGLQGRYGFNLMAGLLRAQDYLRQSGTTNQAVVYITESNPTFVCNQSGNTDNTIGTTEAGTKSIEYVPTFLENNPGVNLYMLDVANENTGAHDVPVAMGNKAKELNRGDIYTADTEDELRQQFEKIITTIIPGDKTKDLTVVDTLSDKVVFLGNSKETIDLSAKIWLGSKTGEGTDVSDYVDVDFESKPKTVTFRGYDTIDGIFYLEIAFDIKTADDVFHESTGYPNTGDEGTDYGTNTTSSNQPGYFSNVKESSTVSYTLNNEPTRTAEFKQPVVQAPEPQNGVYKFTYPDRNETIYYGKDNPGDNGYFAYQMYTKTVTRCLKSAEIRGYSGNGKKPGVPTYLWTEEAQALFDGKNPLVTASLEVQGNDYNYDNVSFYKHDIEWPTMIITELPANQSIKVDGGDVVVTAEAPEKTFTFKYVLEQDGTITEGATRIKYAENVTFNPAYKGQEGIHVIEDVTLPENLTYWSSDAQGNDILTTVKTFGMLIRGGYTADDLKNNFVTVYAQTKAPTGDEWKPVIEEATLTRVIADDDVNRFYADYMVDYLNINGEVVQYMINEGQSVQYGLIVMLADKDEAVNQEAMISALNKLKTNGKQSAYIGDVNHFAACFEYNDTTHISDYNRTLFTIDGKYEKLNGKRITAMAYIIVTDADTQDKKYYYSPVNTQIVIKKYED